MDEPTRCLVMHKTEHTRIQTLALQLAEKVNTLTDYNDRLCEIKQNQYQYNQKREFYLSKLPMSPLASLCTDVACLASLAVIFDSARNKGGLKSQLGDPQ